MEKINYGAGLTAIEGYLSVEECHDYIKLSESMGYELASIQTPQGPKFIQDVRNNDRITFDDQALAAALFERAQPFLPGTLNEWSLLGLNERFRFYRYTPGQYFKWHKDGFFCRTDNEVSLLSFLIYLNDGYEGGNTEFQWEIVKPKIGMVLFFPHAMRHQGAPILSGAKYVLRSDVMYRR